MENITEILDKNNIIRNKCKVCGNDIIYDNTKLKYRKNGDIEISGTSFKTYKDILGKRHYLKVCQNCLFEKFNITKSHFNIMWEPTKFAFEIMDDEYELSRKEYAMTKDKMIKKYGEEEGLKRWDTYVKRQAETNTFEYKEKTYGWTKDEFKEFNKSRAVTKDNLIKKHGEEGLKKWYAYVEKQSITKSWDYMVSIYGEEKAREINKSKATTLENFISRYGEEEGLKRWDEWIEKHTCGVSEVSQRCFDSIDQYLKDKYETYYSKKNKEFEVKCGKNVYYLDYYIKDLNICVEFNGSVFHGDERLYEDDCHCNPFNLKVTAKELREKDKERYKSLYLNHRIKTYVIWELDYDQFWDPKDFIKNTLKLEI